MNASQAIVRGTVAAWLLLASAPVQAAGAGTILGEWYTEGDESRVEIYECGAELCGRIVWLKTPNYSDSKDGPIGTPILDSRNPDPSLRERPVNGLRIMQGFRQEEEATWGAAPSTIPRAAEPTAARSGWPGPIAWSCGAMSAYRCSDAHRNGGGDLQLHPESVTPPRLRV